MTGEQFGGILTTFSLKMSNDICLRAAKKIDGYLEEHNVG
jgi:hypothetical protein